MAVCNRACFVLLFLALALAVARAQLSASFYDKTCPGAGDIVKKAMADKFKAQRVAAAGLLRICFHDAMVEGLDASVLIGSTQNNKAEKDFDDNLSLPGDGFDAVFKAKAALDQKCPGVVSCADALVMATKELLVLMGGPGWTVRLGRKDGRISQASRVAGKLPNPNMSVDQLVALFGKNGFSLREMVVLSGGHSAGFAHCNKFMDRIYNFNKTGKRDPIMDANYATSLKPTCPTKNLDPTVVANLDVDSPTTFDNVYYKNLQTRRGLLRSDQLLWEDPRTRGIVNEFASDQNKFRNEFKAAMDKLTALNVKTGSAGEIRKNCGAIN